jgi:FKBP-type peptidyl-prolyl cis-trans isomerase FkpA
MKKNLMFLAIAAIGMAGCKGGFQKSDGGMLYNIVDHKSGATPIKQGDFISLQGVIKNDKDSVLNSTYEMGQPSALVMPKPVYKGDLISALSMMSEGDSAIVKINTDTMVKKGQQLPPNFKGKYLVYALKIEKVIPKGKLTDQVFQGKISEYFKGVTEKVKGREPAKIQTYIEKNKLNVTKTASGLNYVITQPGAGDKPAVGDTVEVNYTGKFVNGKVFDTSVKDTAQKSKTFNPMRPYKAVRIPVGVKAVIPGWDEGLMLLNKGAKATFVIPSNLAYGEQGGGQIIPPYTPLVFNVEILNIIKPNPNAPKPVAPPMPQMQQQQAPPARR